MKKIVIALIYFAAVVQVWGQSYDTVYNRSDELYYSEWYDTALAYWDTLDGCCFKFYTAEGNTPSRYYAFADYTSRPLLVRGLALMHTLDYTQHCEPVSFPCSDTSRVPEYACLYQGDGDSLIWLATVRWDTARPQVLKLPRKQDTARYGFEYCYLYRVYFDTPIEVDSVFYISGSIYNNYYVTPPLRHRPTVYVGIGRPWSRRDPYVSGPRYRRILYAPEEKGPWWDPGSYLYAFGPFFPIAPDPSCLLELRSADSTMGGVRGGGWYLDSSFVTIAAEPERGYRFTHWNDGDSSNPRTVLLTQDTSFTAYFEEAYCTLRAAADPEQGGMVTGGGTYRVNDTATMAAQPNVGYAFVGWHDGDTARTRQLEVTQDTVFVALFRSTQGIDNPGMGGIRFTLTPNPAHGTVTVESEGVAAAGGGTVTVTDAAGKTVLRAALVSDRQRLDIADLPAGTYFVTLTTTEGTSTQRLVIK